MVGVSTTVGKSGNTLLHLGLRGISTLMVLERGVVQSASLGIESSPSVSRRYIKFALSVE